LSGERKNNGLKIEWPCYYKNKGVEIKTPVEKTWKVVFSTGEVQGWVPGSLFEKLPG
jgi:hypothetical protein